MREQFSHAEMIEMLQIEGVWGKVKIYLIQPIYYIAEFWIEPRGKDLPGIPVFPLKNAWMQAKLLERPLVCSGFFMRGQ